MWLQCASDGSGDFPREERLRRCGYAVYYGPDHPWNLDAPLAGQIQTVPRSELRIFCDVIPRVQLPTEVACDCLGVATGMQQLLRGQKVRRADHQDLWHKIEDQIKNMDDPSMLVVRKVKARLAKKDVEAGKIDKDDWRLNDNKIEIGIRLAFAAACELFVDNNICGAEVAVFFLQ